MRGISGKILKSLVRGTTVFILSLGAIPLVYAGGGHYQPGYVNIRDFAEAPSKGFAALIYNPFYWSSEYHGNKGKKLAPLTGSRSFTVKNAIRVDATGTAAIGVNVKSYAVNPLLFYFSDFKIFGAKYAFGIAPSYNSMRVKLTADVNGTLSVNGATIASGSKKIVMKDSANGFGDLMVRPVMLDWSSERYDIVTSYSFYAPTGKYKGGDIANVGLGYWSHEASLGGLYYFNKKTTALLCNATYEFNTQIKGQDIRPGQNLALEYGVDQFLATWLEVAVSGSSYFQMTEDSGSDARNKSYEMMTHSVGGEVDLWLIPGKVSLVGRYFYQYYAKNDLKGQGANATLRLLF